MDLDIIYRRDIMGARKKEKKIEHLLLAGFGGQGIRMLEDKAVTWVPSYGAEMRGGTANCMVTISEEDIDSPVFKSPEAAIIMNLPSLYRFEKQICSGGVLLINSSLVKQNCQRKDLEVYEIPANDLAKDLGNIKTANMVMIGALIEVTNVIAMDSIIECINKIFSGKKEHLVVLNRQALQVGTEYIIYLRKKERLVV